MAKKPSPGIFPESVAAAQLAVALVAFLPITDLPTKSGFSILLYISGAFFVWVCLLSHAKNLKGYSISSLFDITSLSKPDIMMLWGLFFLLAGYLGIMYYRF